MASVRIINGYRHVHIFLFRDYATVLEKMLSTGYDQPLTLNQAVNLTCDTPRVYPLGYLPPPEDLENRCPTWQCHQNEDQIHGSLIKMGNKYKREDGAISGLFQLAAGRRKVESVLAQEFDSDVKLAKIAETRCSNKQLWRTNGGIVSNADGEPMIMEGVSSFELIMDPEDENLASIRATGTDQYLRPVSGKLDLTLGKKYDWKIVRI